MRSTPALELHRYVERASFDLSGDSFLRYMNELNRRIFDLLSSVDVCEKLGGVSVLDQLMDVPYEEHEMKIIRFAQYLRMVFASVGATGGGGTAGGTSVSSPPQPAGESQLSLDYRLLQAASAALGHLARVGGTIAADVVEFQVRQSLEWLEGGRSEQRRYAAVLVLKELAENHH